MYTTISNNTNIEGFNLVGNPYACTIDLTKGGISLTNISGFIYELNPGTNGTYGIFDLNNSGTPGTNNASKYIASGQGFFVQAKNTSATLTFTELCKSEGQQNTNAALLLSKAPVVTAVPQYLRLRMALDSINSDETVISFKNQAKTSYVFNEDAPYMQGTGKVSLASLSSDNKLIAINTMPLAIHGDTVALNVGAAKYATYSISLNSIQGIPELYDIWLMDKFVKDSVNLRTTATYNFDITTDKSSFGANRFVMVVRENPANAYQLLSFTANKIDARKAQLAWTTKNEENYTNFTVERSTDNGNSYQVIGSLPSTGAGQYSLLDNSPLTGDNLYRLKQVDYNNVTTYSSVIDLKFSDGSGNPVSCYPNPAVSLINVAIASKSQVQAIFNIKITNSLGIVVKSATITELNWANNISNLPMGTYLVQVTDNKDNRLVGSAKFVKL